MARSSRIVFTSNPIPRNIAKMGRDLPLALQGIMHYKAPDVQNYARTNAPWTDRTSNARNGLMAEPFAEPTNHGIVLYHSVDYGLWLEVRFSGKYAIIMPTIEAMGPEVMAMVRKLMRRL